MRRNGYTIEALAEVFGVAERTIYRWRVLPEIPPHVDLALEALEARRAAGHRPRTDAGEGRPAASPRPGSMNAERSR